MHHQVPNPKMQSDAQLRTTIEDELSEIGEIRFSFEDFIKYELKLNLDSRKLTGGTYQARGRTDGLYSGGDCV
jgi:hypothetical protein